MKRLILSLMSALLLFTSINVSAQTTDIYHTNRIDTVMLSSKYFDFNRKVFICLPQSYDELTAIDFDVVYTVDAQTTEQYYLECGMFSFAPKADRLTQPIVVGICSPQTNEYSRNHDFLPDDSITRAQYHGRAGNADKLARFIKEELQPYIRSHYRTTERSLGIGHSLGASFMLHCLLAVDPFDDYFFLSPNLAYGKGHMMPAMKFINHKFSNKNRYLFFSDAGEERISSHWGVWKPARDTVYSYLRSGKLPNNIRWEQKSYRQYKHWTSLPFALIDAYTGYTNYLDSLNIVGTSDIASLSAKTYRKHIELIVKDKNEEVYITGNQPALGNWDPKAVKMTHVNDSVRAVDVDLHLPAQFKFTVGDWSKEADFVNSYCEMNQAINNCNRQDYIFRLMEWMQSR